MINSSCGTEFKKLLEEISGLGIKPCLNRERMNTFRELFNQQQFDRIIGKMLGDMNLRTKISYEFVPDSFFLSSMKNNPLASMLTGLFKSLDVPFDRYREPATINVSELVPMIGTDLFEQHRFSLKIGETMQHESAESFVYLLAHEFSHVALYARKHPLRSSEFATDACVIAYGYGDVMKIGRRMRGNTPLGYLNDAQFEIAYKRLRYNKSVSEHVKEFFVR